MTPFPITVTVTVPAVQLTPFTTVIPAQQVTVTINIDLDILASALSPYITSAMPENTT